MKTNLFGRKDESSNNPESQQRNPAQVSADKLAAVVRKHDKAMQPINKSRWSQSFARLYDNHTGDEIDTVLDWYIAHFGEKFVPHCYSAESFRKDFKRIKEAMKRTEKNTPVLISEEARRIVSYLKTGGYWPAGSDQDLPFCVQKSLDNYSTFDKKFRAAAAIIDRRCKVLTKNGTLIPSEMYVEDRSQWALMERLRCLREHLRSTELTGVLGFTHRWWQRVQMQIQSWPDWSGNLRGMIFDMHGERFRKYGRGLVYEYCNNSVPWDQLFEIIDQADPG